jgi:hypothetical protein
LRHAKALEEAIEKEYERRGLEDDFSDGCLWPEKYAEDSYESCLAFAYECKTYNEANRQEDVIAHKEYLDWATWHWYDTRKSGRGLITWKSRRLVYSWWSRALELWDAGLARSATQIGAKTYEGDSGSQAFIWRIYFIYTRLQRDFPEWNLPKCIPGGNPIRYVLEGLILANGSKFQSINSEKESFRGSGATRAVCEELSSYSAINAVWGQANLVCQGRPGQSGGHPVAIANTSPANEWLELKAKSFVDPRWPDPPRGCEAWETPDGNRVIKIHYSADPEKDVAWVVATKKGIPEDEWAREMEMDESIEDGVPVFGGYDDDTHCPNAFRQGKIPIVPGSFYVGGWDCGQTLTPAFVLDQISPKERQITTLLEVVSPGGESMKDFAPRVLDVLMREVPEIMSQIEHVADATVVSRSGTDGRSAKQEAMRHGIKLNPVSNAFEERRSAGAWALARSLDDEKPGLLIDGTRAPVCRAALAGKYKYKLSASGDTSGPGQVILRPLKNSYSHVAEAWAYAKIRCRKIIEGNTGSKVTSTLRVGKAPERKEEMFR